MDVCCVTETWFSNNVPNSLICFNGYRVFRRDRGTYGGGVAIYIKDNIHSEMVEIPTRFNNVEIICVDLMFNDIDYRVICLYRKPGFSAADVDYINDCIKCLQGLCSTDKLVVITGDCNLPDINWSYYHAPNNPIYNTFLDFVNNYGFHQYVNEPTRDNHILDIVMATDNTFLNDISVLEPLGSSDHNILIFKVNAPTNFIDSPESELYYDFAAADYSAINYYLNSFNWSEIFSRSFTVEDSWQVFTGILNDVVTQFVPVRYSKANLSSKHKAIRYPRYIRTMLHNKAVLWKRWKLSNCAADKLLYKAAATSCRSAIRKFHVVRETALIRKNNLGSFYNYVNSKIKSHPVISKLKTPNGSFTSDNNDMANVFNCFFSVAFIQVTMAICRRLLIAPLTVV